MADENLSICYTIKSKYVIQKNEYYIYFLNLMTLVRDGLKQQKNAKAKAAYRQKHESDFIIADAAARYFRENGISKLPSYKALQAEIETLIQEKNSGYNDYRAKREEYRRLQTVKGNIDQILRRERKPVKKQEQER